MGITRKPIVEKPHVFVQHGVSSDRRAKIVQLLFRRQFTIDQQVARLYEIAVCRKDFDGVAPISKYALFTVEKSDIAGGRTGVDVPGIQRNHPGFSAQT